jgi:endothelin-converting enzyme
MESSDIDSQVPQISITKLIGAQVPSGYKVHDVIVRDLSYYGNISSIITSTPRPVLHAFFQWHLINTWSSWLDRDMNRPLRIFRNRLSGLPDDAKPDRWKTCAEEMDSKLGWILSGFYVERAFSPQAKEYGDRIIQDVKAVFTERLKDIDWMSESVKARAANKGKELFRSLLFLCFRNIISSSEPLATKD